MGEGGEALYCKHERFVGLMWYNHQMFGVVYLLKNTISGKVYVGQTTARIESYIHYCLNKKVLNNNRLLDRAIKKYGPDCWIYEILAVARDRKELDDLEIALIAKLSSRDPSIGYNITRGGERGPGWKKGKDNPVHTFTSEILKKIGRSVSKATKGKPKSEAHKKAMSASRVGEKNHMTGKKHSQETKAKMRQSALGRRLVNNKWVRI